MARETNTLLRVLVPALALGLGVAVAVSIFRTAGPTATTPTQPNGQTPAPTTTPEATATSGSQAPAQTSQPTTQAATPNQTPAATPPADAAPTATSATTPNPPSGINWTTLRAQAWSSQSEQPPAPLGSLDKTSSHSLFVTFPKMTSGGAGLEHLQLTNHFVDIKDTKHVTLQHAVPQQADNPASGVVPFSALALEVTPPALANQPAPAPQVVRLFDDAAGPVWRIVPSTSPETTAQFEALIADAGNQPVIRITRTYMLSGATGGVQLLQQIENLTPFPVTIRWFQMAQIDLPQDALSYGGDKRRMRFGHLLSPAKDPAQTTVFSDDYVISHDAMLGSMVKGTNAYEAEKIAWPNALSQSEGHQLVWAGFSNRYFSLAAFPITDAKAVGVAKTFQWVDRITRIYTIDPAVNKPVVGLRLDSKPLDLAPAGIAGNIADVSMNIYAGPLARKTIHLDPVRESSGLGGLVLYNFGGPCGPCTFGWMTMLLIGLLRLLHDFVFFDWAIAIIFLVVVVRSILHPVTKWSQIRIQRFGKQMSAVAPKQKELQEKYKDDPKKLQVETARLWKEEGISPTGMLGCIPMFLQTPVWIALYATLYFAFELRHQGAFYGLFQAIQPTASPFWQFMGDLAEPDRFLYFGKVLFTVPLLGPIESFNILPLILGVVFFIQQKYLTPPSATPLTPEMQMQQTMMKWMMVVMFPVFMYNAPSGLAVYFIANSVLGILESKWIKHHMDKHGLLDLDKMKADRLAKRKGKPEGESFIERVQRMAEDRSKQMTREQMKKK
jgi:YidC/Oxa1 family membrane protein insertase